MRILWDFYAVLLSRNRMCGGSGRAIEPAAASAPTKKTNKK